MDFQSLLYLGANRLISAVYANEFAQPARKFRPIGRASETIRLSTKVARQRAVGRGQTRYVKRLLASQIRLVSV
jgi:hypothetical protein